MLTPSIVALVFGVVFVALWLVARTPGALVVGIGWFLYAPYEFLMYARVLCSGECNIRVDLLLFWPLLFGGSLVVPLRYFVRRIKSQVKR